MALGRSKARARPSPDHDDGPADAAGTPPGHEALGRPITKEITMKTMILAATAGILVAAAAIPAFAQTTEQTTTVVTKRPNTGTGVGAVGGAAAGAVVGGPVGAVVGGVVGAAAGHTADPPAEVRTYVRTQHVEAVPYDGQIGVGAVLPDTVREYDIP